MTQLIGERFRPSLMVLVLGAGLSGAPAWAQWPSDPASPLVLGGIQALGQGSQSTVASPDGAVWVSWIDKQCLESSLRVQRVDATGALLIDQGLAPFDAADCAPRTTRMAACADGSIVVSAVDDVVNGGGGPLVDRPVYRISPDGSALWGDGLIVSRSGSGVIGDIEALPGGDVLIAWFEGWTLFVNRYGTDGNAVWPAPAAIPTVTGPSKRIVELVVTGAGDSFLVWDEPAAYTRVIFVARVTSGGAPAWPQPIVVTGPQPGSSRHTHPAAIADGFGGALVAWTQGAESADTIVPVRIQRIATDGSFSFESEGRRVSLDQTRQFDCNVSRDTLADEYLVAWRDGRFVAQTLRAQRMGADGARLWGDSGVGVTDLVPASSANWFDGLANAGTLMLAVGDPSSAPGGPAVTVHRVDPVGRVADAPWIVSDAVPAFSVGVTAIEDGSPVEAPLAVVWVRDLATINDVVVAQRVNPDGSLGGGGASPADLNADGAVDGADLALLLASWGSCVRCPADLTSDGSVDGADLAALLGAWGT